MDSVKEMVGTHPCIGWTMQAWGLLEGAMSPKALWQQNGGNSPCVSTGPKLPMISIALPETKSHFAPENRPFKYPKKETKSYRMHQACIFRRKTRWWSVSGRGKISIYRQGMGIKPGALRDQARGLWGCLKSRFSQDFRH